MSRIYKFDLTFTKLILGIIILLSPISLYAGDITLQWDSPLYNAPFCINASGNNPDQTSCEDAGGTWVIDDPLLPVITGYIVYYGASSGNYSNSVDVNDVTGTVISDLASGTWYFAVSAYNEIGNESDYSEELIINISTTDTTPPVISDVQSTNITSSSASISWITDESSDTQIEYGTGTNYGNTSTLNSSMITSHSQTVNGLAPSILYHYRVISRDDSGNSSVSGDYTFTTASPPLQIDYYCDSDNDGYANISIDGSCTGIGCEPSGCQPTPGNDCNDSSSGINPGATDSDCDGTDNNCDGTPDNSYVPSNTSCGTGACMSTGQLICRSGDLIDTCTNGVPTGDDSDCDGIDDNCDGTPDNNYVISMLSCGTGVCASTGQVVCQAGAEVNTCVPDLPDENPETTCNDGLDNDCNGQVDEGCYPDISISNILLSEDFSSGMPEAWAVQGAWSSDNPCSRTIDYPFEGQYIILDSACATTGTEEFVTESFDTTLCNSIDLSFSNQYYWYSGNIDVDISDDGGTTWSNAVRIAADDGYPAPNWKDIDISSLVDAAEAKVNFRYSNDTADGFWAIDNVWVTCQSNQVQISSQIQVATSKTMMITNAGLAELGINTMNITGVDASEFNIGVNNGCSNQTLLTGDTCLFDIVFTPASAGSKTANLSISSNDPDTPTSNISLIGNGSDVVNPAPIIKVNGSSDPVVISTGDNVSLTIELEPGSYSGKEGDWWILMEYKNRWHYYSSQSGKWRRGNMLYQQGPLTNIGPVEVLNNSRLRRGHYSFHFGVDTSMNGVQDTNEYHFNKVTVVVQ